MRANKAVALSFSVSRRAADALIEAGKIRHNKSQLAPGQQVQPGDKLSYNGVTKTFVDHVDTQVVLLHKPKGYTCSHASQQDDKLIFELLPAEYRSFSIAGRLDKDSSGLVVLTNDGELAQSLAHPSAGKLKQYQVTLDRNLLPVDARTIQETGVRLLDGVSKMNLQGKGKEWLVGLQQGRNRQIRRTFGALNYTVTTLHRSAFGEYHIDKVPKKGDYLVL